MRQQGEVKAIHLAPGELRLRCSSPEPAWLIVSDTDFPGWQCRIGRREQPVARFCGMLRSLPIDPGETVIEMRYVPRSLRVGGLISAGGLAVLLVVGIRAWTQRRVSVATDERRRRDLLD